MAEHACHPIAQIGLNRGEGAFSAYCMGFCYIKL